MNLTILVLVILCGMATGFPLPESEVKTTQDGENVKPRSAPSVGGVAGWIMRVQSFFRNLTESEHPLWVLFIVMGLVGAIAIALAMSALRLYKMFQKQERHLDLLESLADSNMAELADLKDQKTRDYLPDDNDLEAAVDSYFRMTK